MYLILFKEGPCNGLREFMIKKGVDVYNIDEFCTSKTCWRCGDSMQKSRLIQYDDGRFFPSHGVLTCSECQMTLNRDVNGALNIHHLVYNEIHKLGRPTWLRRN